MADLAQLYKRCSKNALAELLDRDPAKIVPDSGNPKLDLVFNIANILEWPVGEVAEALWGIGIDAAAEDDGGEAARGTGARTGPTDPLAGLSFKELDQRALAAYQHAQLAEMLVTARRMQRIASTPKELACAMSRLGSGLLGQGWFQPALQAFQSAIGQPGLEPHVRRMIRANVATAHMQLWNLTEAEAIAAALVVETEGLDRGERRDRVTFAAARSAYGRTLLRRFDLDPTERGTLALRAIPLLESAERVYASLSREFDLPDYEDHANACRGLLLEARVEAGVMNCGEALRLLDRGLDAVVDSGSVNPLLIEGWGYWCIAGLNLALRHMLEDERDRAAAIYSNKLFEIAEVSGNWALWERAFQLGFLRATSANNPDLKDGLPLLDRDDVRTLVGTMGRFPGFRPTGWAILRESGKLGLQ